MTTGMRAPQHPDQLLAGGEAGEGPALGRRGHAALGHGVERRLGQRPGHPDEEGQHHLGQQASPRRPRRAAATAMSQMAPSRICCSISRCRSRATSSRPSRAPTPLAPSANPYHQSAACSRRRPKARRKTKKPASPRMSDMVGQPEQHLGMGDRLQAGPGRGRPARPGRPASAPAGRPAATGGGGPGGVGAPRRRRRPAAGRAAGSRPRRPPAKTKASKTSTAGGPGQLQEDDPGTEATNPASVPSRVSRAFRAAYPAGGCAPGPGRPGRPGPARRRGRIPAAAEPLGTASSAGARRPRRPCRRRPPSRGPAPPGSPGRAWRAPG